MGKASGKCLSPLSLITPTRRVVHVCWFCVLTTNEALSLNLLSPLASRLLLAASSSVCKAKGGRRRPLCALFVWRCFKFGPTTSQRHCCFFGSLSLSFHLLSHSSSALFFASVRDFGWAWIWSLSVFVWRLQHRMAHPRRPRYMGKRGSPPKLFEGLRRGVFFSAKTGETPSSSSKRCVVPLCKRDE